MREASSLPACSSVSLKPQNAALPSRASTPSIETRDTPARFLDRAGVRNAFAARRASAAAKRVMARQSEPGRLLEQVRIDRRVIDRRIGQRQSAGLVEHDGIGLSDAFDGVAAVEDDAGAEQLARSDHLHRRNGQRDGAGTGDDEHGDGGDDRECSEAPAISQPMQVSAAAV